MVNSCTNCGCDTTNPKFCTRTCSVTYNNLRAPKRARTVLRRETCANCETKIVGAGFKFCNSKCSALYKQAQVVLQWKSGLLTARPPGSRLPQSVRQAVLDEQGGKCALCGIEPEWNGTSLTLVLDHIDGNSSDDSPENVRLVCPNCDSQLPTYKSKNRGNGRHYRRERYAAGKSY